MYQTPLVCDEHTPDLTGWVRGSHTRNICLPKVGLKVPFGKQETCSNVVGWVGEGQLGLQVTAPSSILPEKLRICTPLLWLQCSSRCCSVAVVHNSGTIFLSDIWCGCVSLEMWRWQAVAYHVAACILVRLQAECKCCTLLYTAMVLLFVVMQRVQADCPATPCPRPTLRHTEALQH